MGTQISFTLLESRNCEFSGSFFNFLALKIVDQTEPHFVELATLEKGILIWG